MSIWQNLTDGNITSALGEGLRRLFSTTTGILMFIFLGMCIYLLKDSHGRVSPPEHNRVERKLDECEKGYDSVVNAMVISERFYGKEVRRFDSIISSKDLEIQKRDFIIQQYERTIKTATK